MDPHERDTMMREMVLPYALLGQIMNAASQFMRSKAQSSSVTEPVEKADPAEFKDQ